MNDMQIVAKFIELMQELEKKIKRDEFNNSDIELSAMLNKLKNKQPYKSNYNFLTTCREIRNIVVHEPKYKNKYVAVPNKELLEELEFFVKILNNPPKAIDKIAIKADKIYKASMEDSILDVMKFMKEKCYTHVPIYENNNFFGVFSENTLFTALLEEEILETGSKTTFKDIERYLPINRHINEEFLFVKKDILEYDIENLFKENFSDNKKVSVIYITQNGKNTESILGMITSWDILGK